MTLRHGLGRTFHLRPRGRVADVSARITLEAAWAWAMRVVLDVQGGVDARLLAVLRRGVGRMLPLGRTAEVPARVALEAALARAGQVVLDVQAGVVM